MSYSIDLNTIDYYDIKAETLETGRTYFTPNGPAPSVTTILGSQENPALDAWRERVGLDEAKRITKEATDIGTLMHDSLESFIKGEEYVPNPDCNPDKYLDMALDMAQGIKTLGFRKLNEVHAVEIPLHFHDLYAGRTDLIGKYNLKNSVMDYKTTKFPKSRDHLTNYRMQIGAYSICLKWQFGLDYNVGANLFATRPSKTYNKPTQTIIEYYDEDDLTEAKCMWADLLITYYDGNREQYPKIDELISLI